MRWRRTPVRRPGWGAGRPAAGTLPRIALAVAAVLAVESALIVGGSGQVVALPAGTPIAESAATKNEKGPKQAADIPSARVAARLYGHRVEALDERTETSTTWVNKDGSLTTELSAGPIRFQRDDKWVDVDVDLTERADGSIAAKAHPSGLVLAGKGGTVAKSLAAAEDARARDLITLGSGDEEITLRWKGGLPQPKVKGTTARYENAIPGADLVVEATRTGFEQFVEIAERPDTGSGTYAYTLPLDTKGLKVRQLKDGSLLFTDEKSGKKKRAVTPAPVMWDATVDKRSGGHTRKAPVDLSVVKNGDGVDLVVTPDAGFLADKDTKYPVTVDPSTSSLGNVFDTYVQQGETVDWSADTELDFGNPGTTNSDGTARTARSFITLNTKPIADSLVSSARLSLYNFHSGNTDCAAQAWQVWSTSAPSTSSRWTAQPTWNTQYATSTETTGNSACAADGWINADVTTLAQAWASAKNSTSHLGVRAASEGTSLAWKRVNSANAATNPPKLTVTYNYRPRTGTAQQAGPPYFVEDGVWTVDSTTPTLQDTFTDTDGDKVDGTFEIRDAATDTQVGTYLVSPYVPSGRPASVTVPAGVLTDGRTYKFRTSPYDGTHYNTGWSDWATFTVDATAPSAPAGVTSADYPSGAWVKGAGQPGTFTVTPPSGSDHRWFEWSLDGVEWTKKDTDGSSPVDLTVTPDEDGTHTLQVRTVDAADHRSETVEYTFHAGPGGLSSPEDGTRTARRLSLVADADPAAYDSVTFLWRRSEEDDWTDVPVGHVRVGGEALPAWPLPLTDGANEAAVWEATDTVDPDGTIQLKADFTGPSDAAASTEPITAVVDRDADTAASTEVGPGHLNLLTGDLTLAGTEETYFGLSASRTAKSRQPAAGAQEGQVAIFGEEWTSGVVAEVASAGYTHIRRTSDTSLDVVLDDGTSIYFTAKAADTGGWVPEPGAEAITLTGTFAAGFTLTDTDGGVSTFDKVASDAETWQLTSAAQSGVQNSTTDIVSEAVTVDGKVLARPRLLVASGGAVDADTCATAPSTRGCRVLQFTYADSTTATGTDFGDFVGQVKGLVLWSTETGDTAATARTVQAYSYDASGRLREAWNPLITPSLKTSYAYDSDGRVIEITPPGQLPWTFGYGDAGGSAGGDGMLLTVSRATLQQGSATVTDGDAVTSVVYDVPLSGDSAPHAMNASAVREWGQLDHPTDATALFPADSTPASHQGGELTADGYGRAVLHYLDASGEEVNSIDEAGGITTTESDRFGNTVRELSAGDHALALGATGADQARLDDLGIGALSVAERARLLSTLSYYNGDGTRLLEQFQPLRRVDLTEDFKDGDTVLIEAGTSVSAQPWTVNEYDEGRPSDGSASIKNQVTLAVTGARVRGHYSLMSEKRLTETQYDWVQGLPVHSIEDPGGLDLVTTTEYDAQGRITAVVPPGGTGEDATSRITVYWSADGDGWCEGRPEWVGLECWTGPAGDITGGGDNPAQLVDVSTEYGYYGQVTEKTETSGDETRVTTVTYDSAGRVKSTQIDGGPGTAVPGTSFAYDEAIGKPSVTMSADGGTIYTEYDSLGRVISYTDADDGVTTTEYDEFDRPVKVTDSAPSTTTYAYDHTAEPRGLPTSLTDSVAGTFTAVYDVDGAVAEETLPGGYTMTQTGGKAGLPYERVYTRDSDGVILLTDIVTESVHEEWTTHSGGAGAGESQTYAYDAIGRLTAVDDTYDSVCTSREYSFDQRTNRTALKTATAGNGADCTTDGATTVTHAYDSANRIVDAGYAYDAFGRTTSLPDGTTVNYHTNDLVRQQTAGDTRQTWTLDAAGRFRGWTTESQASGQWTGTGAKTNHYGGSSDSPRWITDTGDGTIARMVTGLSGGMSATTASSGSVVLQLADLHGDISLTVPLDDSIAPTALSTDEYGNQRTGGAAPGYGWLGTAQRSADTPSRQILMGVRLYNPIAGRFLQADPVFGGSRNAYEYAAANPLNNYDLDGQKVYRYQKRTLYRSWGKVILKRWSNKSNMKRSYSTRWIFNKRWTSRIAYYGPYASGFLAIAAGVVAFIPGGQPTALILLALSAAALAIALVAGYAERSGKCLSVYSRTTVVYRKTFGYTHFYYFTGYAYPWKARC
ncbi:DNRLRE domain-containing protein [Streptomyces sp. NPDC096132]|uniref:DNRLRE domain-containing protein n=1 Tax=Streptomyces sp. NPDC096132 TaxID=3366075 RepID=UPI0038234A38